MRNQPAHEFPMDYPNWRRIKPWGYAKFVENDPNLLEKVIDAD